MIRAALLTVATLATLVLLLALSGLLPVSATGASAVTEWLVDVVQRRSVALRAASISPPSLDDPALVLRGAGHYETACRRCHGMPGGRTPIVLRHMLPTPPDLRDVARRRSDAELFQIIKHGLRFAGMPGWPAQQRDDEVWAMVAFVRALPAINPARYDELVYGPAGASPSAAPPVVTTVCARCHGVDGRGRGVGAFPVLAGQHHEYLRNSLRAFSYGGRLSGIMTPIAASLDNATIAAAAAYYASLPGLTDPPPSGPAEAGGSVARIIARGDRAAKLPACGSCHGPDAAARNPAYPKLGGQHENYLSLQLRLFRERSRGGSEYAHLMHPAADGMTAERARELAAYFASVQMARMNP